MDFEYEARTIETRGGNETHASKQQQQLNLESGSKTVTLLR